MYRHFLCVERHSRTNTWLLRHGSLPNIELGITRCWFRPEALLQMMQSLTHDLGAQSLVLSVLSSARAQILTMELHGASAADASPLRPFPRASAGGDSCLHTGASRSVHCLPGRREVPRALRSWTLGQN